MATREPSSTGRESTPGSRVGQAVDQAQEKAGQVKDQIQEKAGPAVDQTKEKAAHVAEQAREQATSRLDSQREQMVGSLEGVAHASRQTGQQLREQDQMPAGRYADQAAERVERLAGYLRQRDIDQLVDEAERLARRQPSLFLSGGFVLGLLAARFFKSSAQRPSATSDMLGQAGEGTAYGTGPYAAPPSGTQPYSRSSSAAQPAGLPTSGTRPSAPEREKFELKNADAPPMEQAAASPDVAGERARGAPRSTGASSADLET